MADPISPGKVLNINVGVLGHVDSGKTSLGTSTRCALGVCGVVPTRHHCRRVSVNPVRALSELLSTAALDKSPQSQAKGITMDLGFSAFMTQVPERLSGKSPPCCPYASRQAASDGPTHARGAAGSGYDKLQFTLVDCPGHASLIKTIIGGAQIIDMVIPIVHARVVAPLA